MQKAPQGWRREDSRSLGAEGGGGGQREDERRAREKEERMKMKVHVPLAPRQKKLSGKCKRLMTCAVRHYCNHGWQSL